MPTILCNYANEIIYRVPQGVHTHVYVCVGVCVAKRAFKLINLTYTANYANYIEEVKLKTKLKLRLLHFVAATSGKWQLAGRGNNKFLCVCDCVCKA